MRLTTTATLLAALVAATTATADARPRRVVILDFDGPRAVADTGRNEVITLLGEQYDVVAKQRWEEARAKAQQRSSGPQTWQKAAKTAGVDAVIEGWVQDEGRHKLLTVAVREALTGQELDTVSVRISARGLSDKYRDKLAAELEGVLAYVEGAPEPVTSKLEVLDTRRMIGAKSIKEDRPTGKLVRTDEDDEAPVAKKAKKAAKVVDEDIELDETDEATDDDEDRPKKRKKKKAVKADDPEVAIRADDPAAKEDADLVELFGATSDEGKIADPKASHVPVPSPRFAVSAGGFINSRTLSFDSENPAGVTPYGGVPGKGLNVQIEAYPFPRKTQDGGLNGIGFTLGVAKVVGSTFSYDDLDTVTDYNIDATKYDVGVHWRQPLAELVTVDGGLQYGKSSYNFPGAPGPEEMDVPDASYTYFAAGARLDLNITQGASVGFGAKYLYITEVADITNVGWYGPGRASGHGLDATFKIPLPSNLFVQGTLDWTRFKLVYDGTGDLSDENGVAESSDSTVTGAVNLGVQF